MSFLSENITSLFSITPEKIYTAVEFPSNTFHYVSDDKKTVITNLSNTEKFSYLKKILIAHNPKEKDWLEALFEKFFKTTDSKIIQQALGYFEQIAYLLERGGEKKAHYRACIRSLAQRHSVCTNGLVMHVQSCLMDMSGTCALNAMLSFIRLDIVNAVIAKYWRTNSARLGGDAYQIHFFWRFVYDNPQVQIFGQQELLSRTDLNAAAYPNDFAIVMKWFKERYEGPLFLKRLLDKFLQELGITEKKGLRSTYAIQFNEGRTFAEFVGEFDSKVKALGLESSFGQLSRGPLSSSQPSSASSGEMVVQTLDVTKQVQELSYVLLRALCQQGVLVLKKEPDVLERFFEQSNYKDFFEILPLLPDDFFFRKLEPSGDIPIIFLAKKQNFLKVSCLLRYLVDKIGGIDKLRSLKKELCGILMQYWEDGEYPQEEREVLRLLLGQLGVLEDSHVLCSAGVMRDSLSAASSSEAPPSSPTEAPKCDPKTLIALYQENKIIEFLRVSSGQTINSDNLSESECLLDDLRDFAGMSKCLLDALEKEDFYWAEALIRLGVKSPRCLNLALEFARAGRWRVAEFMVQNEQDWSGYSIDLALDLLNLLALQGSEKESVLLEALDKITDWSPCFESKKNRFLVFFKSALLKNLHDAIRKIFAEVVAKSFSLWREDLIVLLQFATETKEVKHPTLRLLISLVPRGGSLVDASAACSSSEAEILNTKTKSRFLRDALVANSVEKTFEWLEAGGDPFERLDNGLLAWRIALADTKLSRAAARFFKLQNAVEKAHDSLLVGESFLCVLLSAAENNLPNGVFEEALEKYSDEKNKAMEGDTPLMCAARHKNRTCALQLIDAGADLSLQDQAGRTAFDIAIESGDEATILLFVERVQDLQKKSHLLERAISERKWDFVRALLKYCRVSEGWCDLDALMSAREQDEKLFENIVEGCSERSKKALQESAVDRGALDLLSKLGVVDLAAWIHGSDSRYEKVLHALEKLLLENRLPDVNSLPEDFAQQAFPLLLTAASRPEVTQATLLKLLAMGVFPQATARNCRENPLSLAIRHRQYAKVLPLIFFQTTPEELNEATSVLNELLEAPERFLIETRAVICLAEAMWEGGFSLSKLVWQSLARLPAQISQSLVAHFITDADHRQFWLHLIDMEKGNFSLPLTEKVGDDLSYYEKFYQALDISDLPDKAKKNLLLRIRISVFSKLKIWYSQQYDEDGSLCLPDDVSFKLAKIKQLKIFSGKTGPGFFDPIGAKLIGGWIDDIARRQAQSTQAAQRASAEGYVQLP